MPTKIEWADEVWNPVTGCTKVSAGCTNCYAERMARRFAGRNGYPPAPDHFKVTLRPDRLRILSHWRNPRTIFVCSMGDLWHEDVPDEFIREVFISILCGNRRHRYLFLTKRPERMAAWWGQYRRTFWHYGNTTYDPPLWPDPCLWFGVTVENQEAADERIPALLSMADVAVRFVSVEPMLGPVRLNPWSLGTLEETHPQLHWVICGGETGHGARPMHPKWPRDLRDQCAASGTPFFFKHWGEWASVPPGHIPSRCYGNLNKYFYQFADDYGVWRVGKNRAARLLDGEEHHGAPDQR